MTDVKRKPASLCWRCRNAVPSPTEFTGCSWSRRYQPVEGWTAEQTAILVGAAEHRRLEPSYRVIRCPEFEAGGENGAIDHP